MNCREAADVIGMSVVQVRYACRKGLLPARKNRKSNKVVEYEIAYKDAMHYRDNRPKKGPKPILMEASDEDFERVSPRGNRRTGRV